MFKNIFFTLNHQRVKGSLMVFIVVNANILMAQQQYNLVNNYSFENPITCPTLANNPAPPFWYIPSNYKYGFYANSCGDEATGVPFNILGDSSYQYANTGDGYMLVFCINNPTNSINNGRNYIQTKLKDSLQKAHAYQISFYVSLINRLKIGCNNISLCATKNKIWQDTLVNEYSVITANAQVYNYGNPIITDTQNWVKISSIFKALGGEKYITIGNFKNDNQTQRKVVSTNPFAYEGAAYYIDDVSVIPLDSFCLQADAGTDTTITIGDSVFIGSYTNGLDSVKWLQGTTVIDSTRPGFWVKPTTGTSYILQQTINGCFSSDTVTIGVLVPLRFVSFILRQAQDDRVGLPTPSPSKKGNVLLQWQTANEINVSHFNIQRSVNGVTFITIGKTLAQNKSINSYEFIDVHLPLLGGVGGGFVL